MSLKQLRDETITEAIIIAGLNGRSALPSSLIKHPLLREICKEIDLLYEECDLNDRPRAKERGKSIRFRGILKKLLRKSLDSWLVNAAVDSLSKPYFPIYFERYRYVSPKRSPMFTDCFHFDQRREVYQKNPIRVWWDQANIGLEGDIPKLTPNGRWEFQIPENYLNFEKLFSLNNFKHRFFDENNNPLFKPRKLIRL